MLEWSWEQDSNILLDNGGLWFGVGADVIGQPTSSELVPESVGLVRIMIPRQQVPLYRGVSPHALDDLVSRVGRGSCVVVNIAGNQYVAHIVFIGKIADTRDRLQPRQLETSHLSTINEAEDFTDLPVGGMNESECH